MGGGSSILVLCIIVGRDKRQNLLVALGCSHVEDGGGKEGLHKTISSATTARAMFHNEEYFGSALL